MTRSIIAELHFLPAMIFSGALFAQPTVVPSPPVKPPVYALVGALGNQFSIVKQNLNVFSHLEQSHFSRLSRTDTDGVLNLLALEALDKVVEKLQPGSERVYLRISMPPIEKLAGSDRDLAILAVIQAQLINHSERKQWDRILVATPAYRLFDEEGPAIRSNNLSKLQGIGVFTQPVGKGEGETFGADAMSPSGKEVQATSFVAPFSYVTVWVLDARDLSVIDKQSRFDHQKLADPLSGSLDVNQSIPVAFLAGQVRGLIAQSIQNGVMQSTFNDKRGVIDIGPLELVKPTGEAR